MTNEKSLISFAVMSVEWNNERDYLDMIIPFVLNSIVSDSKSKIVSLTETRSKLESEFGIKILSNVLELIFRRLASSKYGYLCLIKTTFYLTDKVIDNERFETKRKKAIENQNYVLKELYKFLDDLKIEYNKKSVESDLIKYLSKYGYAVLDKCDFIFEDSQNIENYRIGKFIEHIYINDYLTFEYVKDIVKGAMLVSSIHMQESKKLKLNSKFKGTEVYLDTPLLIYALGYSGKAQEEATKELIRLLQEVGAVVCFFEHTENEIIGILDAYISFYKNNTLYKSYNYDYLIEQNISALDVEQYKITLRGDLERLGLIYKDTLDFSGEEVKKISWSGYEKYLDDHVFYKKDSRRDNDIKSIVSMYMLRKRDNYKRIESCEAIFVTTNLNLVMHSKIYFREIEKKKDYPVIIDDTLLTSIVWLKCTTCSDELPTMKLISDALASQVPNRKFWEDLIITIDKYKDENLITETEVNELKYDTFCKYNIYEITNGDSEKVTHGTLKETLERNNFLKNKEILDKYNSEYKKRSKFELMLIQEAGDKYLKRLTISDLYFALGKTWWIILAIIMFFISSRLVSVQTSKDSAMTVTICTFLFPIINVALNIIEKIADRNMNIIDRYFLKKANSTFENNIRVLISENYDELQDEIIQYCLERKFSKKRLRQFNSA